MNNKQLAQEAWESYCKGYAIDLNKIENINLIAYAFKHAFLLGMNAAEPEEKPYIEPQQMQFIPVPEEKKENKKGFNREYKGRVVRTFKQRKGEAHYLAYTLHQYSERTWKLQDIVKMMRDAGFTDWNSNNATGFIKDAMKYYPNIKRIGYGLYKYEG